MKNEPTSMMDRFLAANSKIMEEAAAADEEAKTRRAVYERKLKKAKAAREKGAGELEIMIADFEKIEAEETDAQRLRVESQVSCKEDVIEGHVSMEEYYKKGLDDQQIMQAARSEAAKKTGFILDAVRAKALEVLRLEVEEAENEEAVMHLHSYAAMGLLEKMRSQLKSLEQSINPGVAAGPDWTRSREKKEALERAEERAISGKIWYDLDTVAIKRLRFDPSIPDSELSALLKIIAEMEDRPGFKVTIQYRPAGPEKLSVLVWR